ncbi:hypothetical protein QYE76_026326 [Lolium multiflorum]|uniref:Uncharacterized protein n=1 Tax=Lolium multiflorum TaxID=4521 RepID=A0AAD8VVH6_LOLMU|nr:hypothetical protein QYE76_026326 [Lolium multiflorum]
MSAVVSKSSPVVVVGQSEPATPGSIINLSSFDNCFVPFPTAALLLFDQPIDDTIETVKKALSQALVRYHPMAGRLATGSDGELHIACTGEGVSFVAASASCSLDELSTTSPLLLKDLCLGFHARGGFRERDTRTHGRVMWQLGEKTVALFCYLCPPCKGK